MWKDLIDCDKDLCHLSWLVYDNPRLSLNYIEGGKCSNGTKLNDLIRISFANCPVSFPLNSSFSVELIYQCKLLFCTQKIVTGIAKCPPLDNFIVCNCSDLRDGTIGIDCGGAKLGDKRTSELLKSIIYSRDVSQLGSLNLAHNHLTRIPKELTQFNKLKRINFQRNTIRSIKTNDFNWAHPVEEINLVDNSLINIEPGTFNG